MRSGATELELPLGDPDASDLARDRLRHLMAVVGVDDATAARLVRSFSSLAAVYAAPEGRLKEVVGPVAAARIRWFLDAPLRTALLAPVLEGPRRAA